MSISRTHPRVVDIWVPSIHSSNRQLPVSRMAVKSLLTNSFLGELAEWAATLIRKKVLEIEKGVAFFWIKEKKVNLFRKYEENQLTKITELIV